MDNITTYAIVVNAEKIVKSRPGRQPDPHSVLTPVLSSRFFLLVHVNTGLTLSVLIPDDAAPLDRSACKPINKRSEDQNFDQC